MIGGNYGKRMAGMEASINQVGKKLSLHPGHISAPGAYMQSNNSGRDVDSAILFHGRLRQRSFWGVGHNVLTVDLSRDFLSSWNHLGNGSRYEHQAASLFSQRPQP